MAYIKSNWEISAQRNKQKIFNLSRIKSIVSPKTIKNLYTDMIASGLRQTHNQNVVGYISVDPYGSTPEFEINLPLDIESKLTRNVDDIQEWVNKNIPGVVLKVRNVQNDDDNTLLASGTMEVTTKALIKALKTRILKRKKSLSLSRTIDVNTKTQRVKRGGYTVLTEVSARVFKFIQSRWDYGKDVTAESILRDFYHQEDFLINNVLPYLEQRGWIVIEHDGLITKP